jgi:L-aminopeptidase/D-esterase-like protein
VIDKKLGGYTVGVLVQSNFGVKSQLTIAGVPVGKELADTLNIKIYDEPSAIHKTEWSEQGSIIVVVATDAPLLPHQLKRIAQRVSLGIGKWAALEAMDPVIFLLPFQQQIKTRSAVQKKQRQPYFQMTRWEHYFNATIQATEEAIVNALVAALLQKELMIILYMACRMMRDKILKKYNRLIILINLY